MSAGAWGYVFGSGLMMFLFFLIFLGLLALIPSLRRRLILRNVLAWLISSLLIGYLSVSGGGPFALLLIASFFSVILAGLRFRLHYWCLTRKRNPEPPSADGQP